MEQEVNFRSSVGGYKKDDVIEYVENTNEEIFRMKKEGRGGRRLSGENPGTGGAFTAGGDQQFSVGRGTEPEAAETGRGESEAAGRPGQDGSQVEERLRRICPHG